MRFPEHTWHEDAMFWLEGSRYLLDSLPPVALMKHPGVSGVDVTRLHPYDADSWRTNPASRDPDISVASPALVAANPDISGGRRDSDNANANGRRWSDANYRLRGSD